MIIVSKEEAREIRERFPFAAICRTVKQKNKRHRYFASEEKEVLGFIDKYRYKTNC